MPRGFARAKSDLTGLGFDGGWESTHNDEDNGGDGAAAASPGQTSLWRQTTRFSDGDFCGTEKQKAHRREPANTVDSLVRHIHQLPAEQVKRFGNVSTFDVSVSSAEGFPFELPSRRYLEEALLGMKGAPEKAGKKQKAKQATANWLKLQQVINDPVVDEVCVTLFWLAVAIIFKRGDEKTAGDLEVHLAQSWHRLTLVVHHVCHDDSRQRETKDWLHAAFPVALVQAVYRLLVDAFDVDRSELIQHTQPLLDKLMQLMHVEVAGFQVNVSTCREARKCHLQRHVVEHPFLNLHDAQKSGIRREMLERQNTGSKPLKFGMGGSPLEETQLQHVMENHAARKKERSFRSDQRPSSVPQDLSVDRYDEFRREGLHRLRRELGELGAPVLPSDPIELQAEFSDSDDEVDHQSFQRHRTEMNFCQEIKVLMTVRKIAKMQEEKRDARAAERRNRKENLRRRIAEESLPERLQERSLQTCWVSPIIDNMAFEGQCRKGEKKSAESQNVKMREPRWPTRAEKSKASPAASAGASTGKCRSASLLRPRSQPASVDHTAAALAASKPRAGGSTAPGAGGDLSGEPPATNRSDELETYRGSGFGVTRDLELLMEARNKRTDPAQLKISEGAYLAELSSLLGNAGEPAQSLWDSLAWKSIWPKAERRECFPSPGKRRHRLLQE